MTSTSQEGLSTIVLEVESDRDIQRFLDDREVTEIMVNSTNPIFVERAGKISRTTSRFSSEEHLRQVIERIVASVGRRVDEASPMVDARLPDGSRVNAIIPPLAVDGPALTSASSPPTRMGSTISSTSRR